MGNDTPKELIYPRTMDSTLKGILGFANFQCAPVAHMLRDTHGVIIPPKAEEEQAYVLHWFTTLYIEHGEDWNKIASNHLANPSVTLDQFKIARGSDWRTRLDQLCQAKTESVSSYFISMRKSLEVSAP